MFDSAETKAFTYLGIPLIQNDFNLTINQNNYIDCICEIELENERLKKEKIAYCLMKKKTK